MRHDGIDLVDLIRKFDSEQKCREYLEGLRWPKGECCPRCDSKKGYRILKRDQFVCDSCSYQFSATSGTIFHDTHLPLWKWFLATYMMCESRKGISANQVKRMLGVSYKTAWYLCHRVRAAMSEAKTTPLTGAVEIDETYIGGRRAMRLKNTNKEAVIGIRQRGGELRFIHARDLTQDKLYDIIAANVDKTVDVILTDESRLYNFQTTAFHRAKHARIKHKSRQYVKGIVHTNTVESAFSLLKRGIIGTWHRVSAKHLGAYLQEMTFRFNNRKNPYLFRDTMLKLIAASNVEYKRLVA